MNQVKTEGWENSASLKWLCEDCQWVVEDHEFCACEYGSDRFPCARSCFEFKHKDDE